ncbi:MAG: TIGR03067 domain-containing protein [Gemmataceae bacterium]
MLARLALVSSILILTGFAPAPPPRVRPNSLRMESFAGRWILVSSRQPGMAQEAVVPGNELEVEIKDGKYTYFRRTKGSDNIHSMTSTILLDPKQKPCWFDLQRDSGPVTTRGICSLEGDKLTICYTTGPTRPTQIDSPEENVRIMVFQRKKP